MLAFVLLLEGLNQCDSEHAVGTPPALGIVGVALGTAIPLTCTGLFFLPRHICRQMQIYAGEGFSDETYLLPLALCIPLAGVLAFLQHEFPVQLRWADPSGCLWWGAVYCAVFCLALFAVRPVGVSAWKVLSQLSGYKENTQSGESSWAL